MIFVTKRDGSREPLDLNKFHMVVAQACDGISNVSASEVELRSSIQFYNGISTADVQETLIKAAADLISESNPNYQYVAGRLISYHLRKEVYGKYDPIKLSDHVENTVKQGYYDGEILNRYSSEEWNHLEKCIDHSRDELLTYAAFEQFRAKYLVKNRVTKTFYETPQMAFMLIAMTLFSNYTEDRLYWVQELYDAISTFDISLPTPIMAGVRTPDRQFSSCVLIESGDSLDSINSTASSVVRYISKKAGIGLGVGRIRAIGSAIRNGSSVHTGVVPFFKLFQAAVKSCSQGGVRGGAATLYFPLWHYEIEDMMVLKNNKGTEENRIRHLDYSVQFNKVMYERFLSGGNITLFSPHDVPDLYESFFVDTDKFRILYDKYERSTKIRKKTVPAKELFEKFINERKNTGRIYLMNVDHVNDHGSFLKEKDPITMSNLCCEITLPTKPLEDIHDENGEISLCTLAAINWGKIKSPSDFERPCRIAVRALDALLDYQDYPIRSAQLGTIRRRPLGVGIINFAYWLAKNDSNYSNPNLELIHEYAEAWSYYLIKSSVELAGLFGAPLGDSKYAQGIFPIDTYKNSVDNLVAPVYHKDWDTLRELAITNGGTRNHTLMALMPAETSAQLSNSTNGIEPPRALVSVKMSKDQPPLPQVVPSIHKMKNKYELLWDQTSPDGYLKIMAVLQKFIDQAISVNTTYNPKFYGPEGIPTSVIMKDILEFYKYGGKNLYYFNTPDGSGEIDTSDLPKGEIEEEDCDSCKI